MVSLHIVVSDTASNMVCAFRTENWLCCFEHVLALSIKHSIFSQSGIKLLIKKVKNLVKKLRTPTGKRVLKEVTTGNQNSVCTLKLPTETRWNSYYIMLDSLQKNKDGVILAQSDTALGLSAREQMSPYNWELVGKALAILKPAYIATKEAEGDNTSVSDVIPLVTKLIYEINNVEHTGIGTFKATWLNEIKRYFDGKYNIESRIEFSFATLLDPRYKTAAFRTRNNASVAKELLIQEVQQLLNQQDARQRVDSSSEATESQASSTTAWLVDPADTEDEDDNEQVMARNIRKQLNEYVKEKRLRLNEDPLSFWAVNKDRFNLLSPLVRKYLSAPPASTSVERLFSAAGNILGTKRLRLKPENLECNLFLKYNLRALTLGSTRTSLPDVPDGYTAPNSCVEGQELPEVSLSTEHHDADSNVEIIISSDEDDNESTEDLVE